MTIQKIIEQTLNYFISKFYLENNNAQALVFENIKEKYNTFISSANEEKLSPSKKHFGDFITILKENIKPLENSADRRLLRSLLAFSFMIRRSSNKEKSYLKVLNLSVNELNTHEEFSKAKFITDTKRVLLSFPRK